jgi:hypothetical protein
VPREGWFPLSPQLGHSIPSLVSLCCICCLVCPALLFLLFSKLCASPSSASKGLQEQTNQPHPLPSRFSAAVGRSEATPAWPRGHLQIAIVHLPRLSDNQSHKARGETPSQLPQQTWSNREALGTDSVSKFSLCP